MIYKKLGIVAAFAPNNDEQAEIEGIVAAFITHNEMQEYEMRGLMPWYQFVMQIERKRCFLKFYLLKMKARNSPQIEEILRSTLR